MKTKLKQTKGITLIALIITIIILLILAMVTIRILMNQGIIKHAENATAAYNDAQNNETEYLTYAEGEMDKYAGASEENSDVPQLLKKYILGKDGRGIDISTIAQIDNGNLSEFQVNSIINNSDQLPQPLNIMYYNNDVAYIYIKYGNAAFKITTDFSTTYNNGGVTYSYITKGIEKRYEPAQNSKEGKEVTYNGRKWKVLYDNGDTVEMVSLDSIGRYQLGKLDHVPNKSTVLNKTIDNYNNAVTLLNTYCRNTLSDNTARCVGSNPTDPDGSTNETYSSTNTDNWNTAYNGRGLLGDNNAEEDYVRMCYWGVESSDDTYWLASRLVLETTDRVAFAVRYSSYMGWPVYAENLWWSSNGNTPEYEHIDDQNYFVRACITVNSNKVQ